MIRPRVLAKRETAVGGVIHIIVLEAPKRDAEAPIFLYALEIGNTTSADRIGASICDAYSGGALSNVWLIPQIDRPAPEAGGVWFNAVWSGKIPFEHPMVLRCEFVMPTASDQLYAKALVAP